jgi:hypothetical protein
MLSLLVVMGLVVLAGAQQPAGFKNTRTVVLSQEARVGGQVLPAGQYRLTHEMEGSEHIMVFRRGEQAVRVKCTMEPLANKASQTQYWYGEENGQRTLQAMTFQGDTVRHVLAEQ